MRVGPDGLPRSGARPPDPRLLPRQPLFAGSLACDAQLLLVGEFGERLEVRDGGRGEDGRGGSEGRDEVVLRGEEVGRVGMDRIE